ncbi:hypothetical protein [Mesorhizobium waimense]|uniref:hypothetical protein n=1 Tax=Mesorhizobium waimense TaxID=1300307 RepID=UPI0011C49DDA|nr:hypothetical protein [Mesorhizobium waimense]
MRPIARQQKTSDQQKWFPVLRPIARQQKTSDQQKWVSGFAACADAICESLPHRFGWRNEAPRNGFARSAATRPIDRPADQVRNPASRT